MPIRHTAGFRADQAFFAPNKGNSMLQVENFQSGVCHTDCRAGSAQPVAFNTPYDGEGESGSQGHHERHQQREAVQHRGPGGLMSHMFDRKLEQAQQVSCNICCDGSANTRTVNSSSILWSQNPALKKRFEPVQLRTSDGSMNGDLKHVMVKHLQTWRPAPSIHSAATCVR